MTASAILPTSPKAPEGPHNRINTPSPTALAESSELSPNALIEYWRDFAQRSVLFFDILRRRGNQNQQMRARTIDSVSIYDFEFVMHGNALPRPVNYALVRVLPPAGIQIDERKRPVVVIDPRAGQGPGIGGFKPVSQISDAFKFGHPVYFTKEPQCPGSIAHGGYQAPRCIRVKPMPRLAATILFALLVGLLAACSTSPPSLAQQGIERGHDTRCQGYNTGADQGGREWWDAYCY
ncbi:MAG TPA: DUF3141 domain-containing protein [Stellaceae bacterium]|nr:DUF3141 domain-containing protein [Stellaceae bacterium]